MKQLSGLDELLLSFEQSNQCMHVAALGIYDPSTVPGGHVRFRDIIAHFHSRLDVAPVFRRRLVTTPMGMDRAYWIDEGDVDLEYHVRHIALPHPGDWRQLCIQVARIHARPLDRTKPLWEAYVIEGLNRVEGVPRGSFAVYVKFHSAAVDGETTAHMLRALHSMIAAPELYSTMTSVLVDREPTMVELYVRTVMNVAYRLPRFGKVVGSFAMRLAGGVAQSVRGVVDNTRHSGVLGLLGMPKPAPMTRFRQDVSPHRVIECVGIPMDGLKVIRNHVEGTSTNDILLSILGGALRSYLSNKGELPKENLSAGVPLTVGNALPGAGVGDHVGFTRVPLHTTIKDPVERLRAIQRDARQARQAKGILNSDIKKLLVEYLPTHASEMLVRRLLVGSMNLVVGDVRGPEVPLYLAGARLAQFVPLSLVVDGMGLSVSGLSYGGTLWVGVVSCRQMMPDPDQFARCLRENFDALLKACEVASLKRRQETASPPPRRPRSRVRSGAPITAAVKKSKAAEPSIDDIGDLSLPPTLTEEEAVLPPGRSLN